MVGLMRLQVRFVLIARYRKRLTRKDGDMDRVALITGGSRGIGAATALLAARQGWKVAVNYAANQAAADEVVQAIRAGGGEAIAVRADVADEAQVLAMFEQVDAQLGRLDGLVNNAGVVDFTSRLED